MLQRKKNRKTSPCSASYVRWQRGTARIRSPLLLSAGRAASTRSTFPVRRAHRSKPATAGLLLCARAGQTDGRTPCRYIDPAQHTVRAVLTSNQLPLISRGGKKYLRLKPIHTIVCVRSLQLMLHMNWARYQGLDLQNILRFIVRLSKVYRKIDLR